MKIKVLNEALKVPSDIFMKDISKKIGGVEIYSETDSEDSYGCYVYINDFISLSASTDDPDSDNWTVYLTNNGGSVRFAFGKSVNSEKAAKTLYNKVFHELCDAIPDDFSGDIFDVLDKKTISSIASHCGLK